MSKFNEGDEVYIYSSGYRSLSRAKITRTTKTQAIIDRGHYEERFNRETGRKVGADTWSMSRIDHPTPQLDAQWRARRVDAARRALAAVASKSTSTPEEIRDAYTKWAALAPKEEQ